MIDPAGRYLLCNVQNIGWGLTLNAWKYPRFAETVNVPTPSPSQIDLMLPEQY